MKLFHARYAQPRGGGTVVVQEEEFYLPDSSAVRRQLRGRGLWPIVISEQRPPLFEWMDVRTRDWQIQLLRALRFQTATISAGTALLNIIESENDHRRRIAFLPTRTVLKGGGSFSNALRELKLLDAATMAIITAGERAGDLKGVIQHAIEHIEEKGKQYKAVVAALGWFSFDIFSTVSTIWGVQFGFIPHLRADGVKSSEPGALEHFERGLQIASIANGFLLVITSLLIAGIVFLAGSFWHNRQNPEHFSARIMMKVPVFSDYMRNVSLQDTCKLMSRLLNGKVPLSEALDIIIESSVEPSARLYWRECKGRIMAGVDPSRALSRWPLSKPERDQIVTIQSVDQLAEVYTAIANERALMAKTDQRRIVMASMMSLMFFGGATVLITIYLLMLQNEGFLQSLNSMRGG